MLDVLAFLPVNLMADGMSVLWELAPDGIDSILDYFDANYVNGAFRSVMMDGRLRFRRTPPRFPPDVWNVHEATKVGEARTNNACESWNNGFKYLVGHANPSLWNENKINILDNRQQNTNVENDIRK